MMANAKRLGAELGDAAGSLEQAEAALRAGDIAMADILIKQAEVSVGIQIQNFIKNKYPNLALRLPSSGLQAGEWNQYVVEVENRGKLPARNVQIEFSGDLETKGVAPIAEIGVGEVVPVRVGVRPKGTGSVPVAVGITDNRMFDENRYEVRDTKEVKVEPDPTHLVGNVLEKWTGLLHQLEGVDELIEKLVFVAKDPNADLGALAESPVTLTAMAIDALGTAQATEANELLAKAQSTLETDIQLAWQFIEQARTQADLVKTQLPDRMGEILTAARDTVNEMKSIGADTSQAELLLREAEEAYSEGKYERVREIQQGLHESLERQKGEIAAKKVEVELASLINDISIAKSQNLDVREAESYLTKIEGAIQKKNPRQMDEYLRRPKESLSRQRRRTVLDRARADMERIRNTVAAANSVHADLSDVEALLLKAEEAMRLEDLKGAEGLIERAEVTAKAKVEGLLKDRYPRLFLETTHAGLQANRWNRFEMNITNKGNWPAEHVTPIVTGPVEVVGLRTVEKIEPNQKVSLEFGLKPKEAGTMDFDFEVHYTRPLDDGKHQTTDTAVVPVEPETGYLIDDGLPFHSTGAPGCPGTP